MEKLSLLLTEVNPGLPVLSRCQLQAHVLMVMLLSKTEDQLDKFTDS